MERNIKQTEQKWSKKWIDEKIFEPDLNNAKDPYYNLMMFPYPSAEGLHVGNMYAFTGSDVFGRFMRMQGKNVFEPIGLDGFGIHSENYAIKNNTHPKQMSKKTEKNYYRQLRLIGCSFAWDHKLETYDPDYYKWTQWLFIKMFENGLAYQKKAYVNWCPSCKTVVSDEQVEQGECERCKTQVIKKSMKQWFFKITNYVDELINDLDKVDWEEKIKTIQKNWIGKSEGVEIDFEMSNIEGSIKAYTTRPDTIEGVTFMVISPEHPLVGKLLSNANQNDSTVIPTNAEGSLSSITEKIKQYIESVKLKSEQERLINKEKTGVNTGLTCINPTNNEQIPIWIADYVLMGYGTGAVMGVPFTDERDREFATKFNIKIKEHGEFKGELGVKKVNYKLRDWCISRQRYWGPPIPIIHCEDCGPVAVPEKDLPIVLPDTDDYLPTDDGLSPLARNEEFVNTTCPKCDKPAKRDTDVSDTFLDSSWYYLRYPSTTDKSGQASSGPGPSINKTDEPWDKDIIKKWLPVDKYIGGAEHAVLHLLYSRFVTKALKDFGYIDFDEPFISLRAHGLIIKDGAKMSKSKGNVINPDTYIERFGADTLRTYLMFMGPLSQGGDFRDNGLLGVHRFLNRVWEAIQTKISTTTSKELIPKLHWTIKKGTSDIPKLKYNTAIAACMEFLNLLEKDESYKLSKEDAVSYLKLLAPFAPFMTEELYEQLTNSKESIHLSDWPKYDDKLTISNNITFPIQINGKLRDTIEVTRDSSEKEVTTMALDSEKIKKHMTSEPKKVIFIPNKLINFVV